jgi:hypothetical protein
MNYPIYFETYFSGSGTYPPPPPPPPPQSPPPPPEDEIIVLPFCEENGYHTNPNSCSVPIEIILENRICYACGSVVAPPQEEEQPEPDPNEPPPPLDYFTEPQIVINNKKLALNSSGNILALGFNNPEDNYSRPGLSTVQIFTKENNNWELKNIISGNFNDNSKFSNFGYSIDINASGDFIIIGAPNDSRAFVYQYNNSLNMWEFFTSFSGSETELTVGLGHDVCLNDSGNVFFISAPKHEGGKVYCHRYGDTSWHNSKNFPNLSEYDTFGDYNFGQSIATNAFGNILFVGAPKYNSGTGAVYIYESISLNNGLVAFWNLDNASNSDPVVSSYGSYSLNLFEGFTSIAGKINQGVEFYGEHQGLWTNEQLWNLLTNPTSFSVSFWHKIPDNTQDPFTVMGNSFGSMGFHFDYFSSGHGYDGSSDLNWVPGSYGISFRMSGPDGPYKWNAIYANEATPNNTWTLVTATYDLPTTTMKLYLNGVLKASYGNAVIGENSEPGWHGFALNGTVVAGGKVYGVNQCLDALGFWNRALNQNEIFSLYNNGNGKQSSDLNSIDYNNPEWNWTKEHVLSGSQSWSYFGNTISANKNGNLLYISAPFETGENYFGALYIYGKFDLLDTWGLKQKITGSQSHQKFGANFKINRDGKLIAISREFEKSIILYTGDGVNDWSFYKTIDGSQNCQNFEIDSFGESLALNSGDVLATVFNDKQVVLYDNTDPRSDPEIDFEIDNKYYGDENFYIYPISDNTSGIFKYYSSNVSVARVDSEGLVKIINPGTTLISVSQSESLCYKSGIASKSLTIYKVDQTLDFPNIDKKELNSTPIELNKYTNVGLPVTYLSTDPFIATINDYKINFIGAGTAYISGIQNGNEKYNPIALTRILDIEKSYQYITFDPNHEYYLEEGSIELGATSSSNLDVLLDSQESSLISFSGNVAKFLGTGLATIRARQGGNNNYYPAKDVYKTINIRSSSYCFNLNNFIIPCVCRNDLTCRNCCGINSTVKLMDKHLNNKNNWSLKLYLSIFNPNCDNISDFYRIYINNKLYKSSHYYIEKNTSIINIIKIDDIETYDSILNINIQIDAFSKTYYDQLKLN